MNVHLILEALSKVCAFQVRTVPIDETFITLLPDCIRPAVQVLIDRFGLCHLSTITGQDAGGKIQLLYHKLLPV